MHFTTIQFAVFFLFILAVNWWLRERTGPYRIFLLAANIVFYGSLSIRFLPLLLTVGFSNWLFARLIAETPVPSAKRFWLTVDLVINLGLLAFFKYFEFFYSALERALAGLNLQPDLPVMEIVFPVGISFFTFQGISYIIDVYRDPERKVDSLLDIMLFVSFFPTVMSGPILRADTFIPQLDKPRFSSAAFHSAFALILSGLFKKIVIASYLSEHIVRQVFQVPESYSSLTVLAGVYAYTIQIYCDFSGYSDLAIGLAMLLGYHIPDNFNSPYLSTSIQDFWRRWHISLSTWLRDYLYIPLGGNRRGNKYVNLVLTMVLGGLWHGAHMRFIIWGALHGLGLAVNHAFNGLASRARSVPEKRSLQWKRDIPYQRVKSFFGWLVTFHVVALLWVFFRAEDTGRAFEIFRAVFSVTRPGEGFEFLVIPAVLTGMAIQLTGKQLHHWFTGFQARLPVALQGVTIALLCILILQMGPDGVLPFIYFQF